MNDAKQRGFTLIEVLVVIVILGILAGLVAPNIIGRIGESRVTAAKSELRAIASALDQYKLDNYNYPTTDQGLKALVEKPSSGPEVQNWPDGGYLKKVPSDPWGNEYVYVSPGSDGPFDLYTLGADNQQGGEGENQDIYYQDI